MGNQLLSQAKPKGSAWGAVNRVSASLEIQSIPALIYERRELERIISVICWDNFY
jgi:hypothetical protein